MAGRSITLTLKAPGLSALCIAATALSAIASGELTGADDRLEAERAIAEMARVLEGVTTVADLLSYRTGPL